MVQNRGYIFLKPIHPDCYRCDSGLYPEINGVVFYKPEGLETGVYYELYYIDKMDYVPVSEVECGNWEFVETNRG